MKYIVFLLMITITGYSQTIDRNNVIARQKLQYSGGNPDSNKIAVSVDANGIFKWVYFSDFQDSVNTAIYDTTTANVVVTQAIRITGATFASDTLLSIGSGGTVTKCFATCDTIQYILDNLGGGGYSPWDSLSGNVFLKDSTDNVGIGTSSPQFKLESIGNAAIYEVNGDIISGFASDYNGTDLVEAFMQNTVNDNQYRLKVAETFVELFGKGSTGQSSVMAKNDSIINIANHIQINIPTAATGYVLTSLDNDGNATWQDPTAYGEMGFGDSTRTIALTQNVFSVVTNTAKNLLSAEATTLHNVTYQGDSLKIDSAGTYQIIVNLSVDGTNASVLKLGVFKNGVIMNGNTGHIELTNNHTVQISYNDIAPLAVGDGLRVVIMNTASNDDATARNGNIIINKIR